MATFVLIPGMFFGGWAWREVANLLRTEGHIVFTPTLTGLGERVHLAHPDIDLSTHTQDVLGVLHYEDLSDVVLVGWSYGGFVISGVAEQAPERLAHLVYLDAAVPHDGETVLEAVGPGFASWLQGRAERLGDGWRVPPDSPEANRGTAQPFKTLTQPLRLQNSVATTLPRTYIRCTETDFAQLPQHAARARSAGWRYHELATGHVPMWTMPQELACLLMKVL